MPKHTNLFSCILRRTALVMAAMLWLSVVPAQILTPVKWSFSAEVLPENEAVLNLTATLDGGFHIYSQFIEQGGPVPTSFVFESDTHYQAVGKTIEEGSAVRAFDQQFQMNLVFFGNKVVFKQKIKLLTKDTFSVKGRLEYMACDDKQCLPPTPVPFEIPVDPTRVGVRLVPEPTDTLEADTVLSVSSSPAETPALEPGCGNLEGDVFGNLSLWAIFTEGFLWGFFALLTPCVFPIIPLTVSFFTKRSTDRRKGFFNALIYAASIIVIYVIPGFLITRFFGPDALNELASNALFNLLFFVVFIVFAISFFGAFEITLPSSWVNRMDKLSDRGGLIGIFFMASTLSLVSFSCTGPLIGTLLIRASTSYLGPLIGMFGFALALALPFAFFAAFPGWLNSLPKSGGWLNTVKVSMGFIELALALKFLSTVDLAYHWEFLKRELFLGIWLLIFVLWGMYLAGFIRFSHEEKKKIPVARRMVALLVFACVFYLATGLTGAPLRFISGYLPPEFYSFSAGKKQESCPHNLNCFHDYDEGMRYAREQKKPVLIDFTGWSCVNCRRMEDNVWSDPRVLKHLSDTYVLISLYVDDKERLPEAERSVSTKAQRAIETKGDKWSEFQIVRFNTNSQPYYVLLDQTEKLLAHPRGYTPDKDTYLRFLEEGLCRFEKRQDH